MPPSVFEVITEGNGLAAPIAVEPVCNLNRLSVMPFGYRAVAVSVVIFDKSIEAPEGSRVPPEALPHACHPETVIRQEVFDPIEDDEPI